MWIKIERVVLPAVASWLIRCNDCGTATSEVTYPLLAAEPCLVMARLCGAGVRGTTGIFHTLCGNREDANRLPSRAGRSMIEGVVGGRGNPAAKIAWHKPDYVPRGGRSCSHSCVSIRYVALTRPPRWVLAWIGRGPGSRHSLQDPTFGLRQAFFVWAFWPVFGRRERSKPPRFPTKSAWVVMATKDLRYQVPTGKCARYTWLAKSSNKACMESDFASSVTRTLPAFHTRKPK